MSLTESFPRIAFTFALGLAPMQSAEGQPSPTVAESIAVQPNNQAPAPIDQEQNRL